MTQNKSLISCTPGSDTGAAAPKKEDPKISWNLFCNIRSVWFDDRLVAWRVLQELFRIDADDSHPYYSIVSSFITKLLNDGFVDMLFAHLDALYEFVPTYLPTAAMDILLDANVGDDRESLLNQYVQAHSASWCSQVSLFGIFITTAP